MKIGIIADTHDNMNTIKAAVEIFKREKIEHLLHAGDHVAPFSIPPLKEIGCHITGVYGNNDGEKNGLSMVYKGSGEICQGPFLLKLRDYKILLMHEPFALSELFDSGQFDLIVYGHTHKKEFRKNKSILMNPGECCGWGTGEKTVAVTNLETKETEFFQL